MAGATTPTGSKATSRRVYRMRSRATAAAATGDRIREAATRLFIERSYDAVSLEAVAQLAGVSLPTVLRKFRSKDALFLECAHAVNERERGARSVPSGDVRGAARMLARRYEQLVPLWKRNLDLEGRFPAVARAMVEARRGHLAWLAEVFEPFLSKRPGSLRTRQLAALFGVTEIYLWWTWRTHLGLSAPEAERVMVEVLEALVGKSQKEHQE